MSVDEVDIYWRAMTVVDAQETLQEMTISSYPHLKDEERQKLHRKYYDIAYPPVPQELTFDLIQGFLNGQ